MVQNKGLVYKKTPSGFPVAGQDLAVEAREFDPAQDPPKGGITTKNYYLSFDPYQRGKMRDPSIKSYTPPYEFGKVIWNRGVARVLKSDTSKFKPGDLVVGQVGTEEYSIIPEALVPWMVVLHNPHNLPISVYLGALGMPGLTAYASFYGIGAPQKGETIFISAASGAVGQLVGQLAKHEGLIVIGSVGSDEKLEFITKELGFDKGFNYKKESPGKALQRLAPEGIDIYYENVGGEHLDAALASLKNYGRVIACGMISQYNVKPGEGYGVKNMSMVVGKKLRIEGFIVGDKLGPKYTAEHQKNVAAWIADGSFKSKESVTEGIDHAAEAFIGMLQGKNFGKAVLKIADPDKD